MDFTNTPLAEPLPDDPVARIHRFARDLAWGAANGLWSSEVNAEFNYYDGKLETHMTNLDSDVELIHYIEKTWGNIRSEPVAAESFGYLNQVHASENGSFRKYRLTQRAFALLEKPLTAPRVFISYRRSESSAFGLLLVARLKAVGVQNPFIDMNIPAGDDWHPHLREVVGRSRYFILLVGKTTLESDYVQEEIRWAFETPGTVIIPVLHDGVTASKLTDDLRAKQSVIVRDESAAEYELAVVKVLNRLGYT